MMCIRRHPAVGRGSQRRGQLGLVERWPLRSLRWINQHKCGSIRPIVAIPEAPILQPCRPRHSVIHQRIDVVRHELLRLRIVIVCKLSPLSQSSCRKTTLQHDPRDR